jgi:hypothetical protein
MNATEAVRTKINAMEFSSKSVPQVKEVFLAKSGNPFSAPGS